MLVWPTLWKSTPDPNPQVGNLLKEHCARATIIQDVKSGNRRTTLKTWTLTKWCGAKEQKEKIWAFFRLTFGQSPPPPMLYLPNFQLHTQLGVGNKSGELQSQSLINNFQKCEKNAIFFYLLLACVWLLLENCRLGLFSCVQKWWSFFWKSN